MEMKLATIVWICNGQLLGQALVQLGIILGLHLRGAISILVVASLTATLSSHRGSQHHTSARNGKSPCLITMSAASMFLEALIRGTAQCSLGIRVRATLLDRVNPVK